MRTVLTVLCLGLVCCSPVPEIPEQHRAVITQLFDQAKTLYGISGSNVQLPNIKLADPERLSYLCRQTRRDCEVMAYFEQGTVVLAKNWNVQGTEDRGYLVHEFIHYFQWHQNRELEPGACVNNYAIELEAYTLQNQWLQQQGYPELSQDQIDQSILATLRC